MFVKKGYYKEQTIFNFSEFCFGGSEAERTNRKPGTTGPWDRLSVNTSGNFNLLSTTFQKTLRPPGSICPLSSFGETQVTRQRFTDHPCYL
jgi:hypothetical protein